MTVNTTHIKSTGTGDGTTKIFPYDFTVLSTSEVTVYVNGVQLTTGFSVTKDRIDVGGTVVFTSAPAVGASIEMLRASAFTQEIDLPTEQPIPAVTLENGYDHAILLIQELADGVATAALNVFPDPQANFLLGWNSAGTAIVNIDPDTLGGGGGGGGSSTQTITIPFGLATDGSFSPDGSHGQQVAPVVLGREGTVSGVRIGMTGKTPSGAPSDDHLSLELLLIQDGGATIKNLLDGPYSSTPTPFAVDVWAALSAPYTSVVVPISSTPADLAVGADDFILVRATIYNDNSLETPYVFGFALSIEFDSAGGGGGGGGGSAVDADYLVVNASPGLNFDRQIVGTDGVEFVDGGPNSTGTFKADNTVIRNDGSIPMAADLDLGSNKIVNLGTGTADSDGVNKGQMNAAISSAISALSAGDGLTGSFDVGAGTGILVNPDNVEVDPALVALTTNTLSMSGKTLLQPKMRWHQLQKIDDYQLTEDDEGFCSMYIPGASTKTFTLPADDTGEQLGCLYFFHNRKESVANLTIASLDTDIQMDSQASITIAPGNSVTLMLGLVPDDSGVPGDSNAFRRWVIV